MGGVLQGDDEGLVGFLVLLDDLVVDDEALILEDLADLLVHLGSGKGRQSRSASDWRCGCE